jgi:hypothetical protein
MIDDPEEVTEAEEAEETEDEEEESDGVFGDAEAGPAD